MVSSRSSLLFCAVDEGFCEAPACSRSIQSQTIVVAVQGSLQAICSRNHAPTFTGPVNQCLTGPRLVMHKGPTHCEYITSTWQDQSRKLAILLTGIHSDMCIMPFCWRGIASVTSPSRPKLLLSGSAPSYELPKIMVSISKTLRLGRDVINPYACCEAASRKPLVAR